MTGLISPARRHVLHTAAFGATMHAAFGPRFILGLGRGEHAYLRHEGLRTAGFDGLVDYVRILRRLWAGETVTYDGPAGTEAITASVAGLITSIRSVAVSTDSPAMTWPVRVVTGAAIDPP